VWCAVVKQSFSTLISGATVAEVPSTEADDITVTDDETGSDEDKGSNFVLRALPTLLKVVCGGSSVDHYSPLYIHCM
jgi:hypothetical protein